MVLLVNGIAFPHQLWTSIRIKALAKSFSHQLWPLLAALARAIIEASAFCSGFNSDVRQFNCPVEPVHIDIIVLIVSFIYY